MLSLTHTLCAYDLSLTYKLTFFMLQHPVPTILKQKTKHIPSHKKPQKLKGK